MVDFKIILSDPDTGRSYKIDATGPAAGALIGKRIGDEIDGGVFGLAGYTIKITGGTDRTGIPARRDLPGRHGGESSSPRASGSTRLWRGSAAGSRCAETRSAPTSSRSTPP